VAHTNRFPSGSETHAACEQLHAVDFYEDDQTLFARVGRFLSAGLEAGDRLVVIATCEHRDGIVAQLDRDLFVNGLAAGRIALLDAHETLEQLMVRDMISPDRFRAMIERLVAQPSADASRVRAFGEMVDVLWKAGNPSAALALEELWEEASQRFCFKVLCAYGNFFAHSSAAELAAVRMRHSHACSPLDDEPQIRSRERLEQHIAALELELQHRRGLELALRRALRDRSHVEAELRSSAHREREARTKAEENNRLKEEFLAMLGHDLRNPLNTVLTTARLMVMRREVPDEGIRRLNRMIVNGVRMQRMVEQMLDVTCDCVGEGIKVVRQPEQDVASIAAVIVREARVAHPSRTVDLLVDGICHASVDRERIEQVLKTLIGNALTHGAGDRPVRVLVETRETSARIDVHNDGPPIADDVRAHLFEPFQRARKSAMSDGLGLGLYIAERIVAAHDGQLEVESSASAGTRFRVTLPRESARPDRLSPNERLGVVLCGRRARRVRGAPQLRSRSAEPASSGRRSRCRPAHAALPARRGRRPAMRH
jgi:signal transduction histidine kinase